MAKTITLRFPGTCRECGAELPAGVTARWYGRGRVYGIGCHESTVWRSRSSAKIAYRVRAGRCEDAPCCGCCGPNGDADDNGSFYGEEAR